MRILIVRHADPDYENDSLTETGWHEARLAAEYLSKLDIKTFYVSPYGRAKATAGCTLEKMNRTATTCDWLREFWPQIRRPDTPERDSIVWDWLPPDWTSKTEYLHIDTWTNPKPMKDGHVKEEYDKVCTGLDDILAKHGYVRENRYYRAARANHDTIAFFCHFGLECVLLSHLLNISPMLLWHGFCAAPSSITSLYTEERREGIAYFRMSSFGETAHLYAAGEEPSFSARFCECFSDTDVRHD